MMPEMQPRLRTAAPQVDPGLLLCGWAAVALGIASRDGRYNLLGLALVVVGTGLVTVGALGGSRRFGLIGRQRGLVVAGTLVAVAAILVAASPFGLSDRYHSSGVSFWLSQVLVGVAGPVAAASLLPGLRAAAWPFWVALGLVTVGGVLRVVSSPDPHIDVFYLLQVSTEGILHGADMYRQQWAASPAVYHSAGLFAVYPYLPATSLLLLPGRLLFGDVRVELVLLLALAAIGMRSVVGSRGSAPITGATSSGGRGGPAATVPALLPLLVAVLPKVTYVDQRAWTEPLLIALLVAVVLAVLNGRHRTAVVCLALALASKQHVVLLLPVAALWPAFGWRRTAAATGLAGLVVLPWFVAGSADMWHDAVSVNLGYGYRHDALCLPTLLHNVGLPAGSGLTALGVLIGWAVAYRIRGDAVGFAAGAAVLLLLLNLTNQQSFFNHYMLGMGLTVLAVAAAVRRPAAGGQASKPVSADRGEALQGGALEQRLAR